MQVNDLTGLRELRQSMHFGFASQKCIRTLKLRDHPHSGIVPQHSLCNKSNRGGGAARLWLRHDGPYRDRMTDWICAPVPSSTPTLTSRPPSVRSVATIA